MLADTGTFRWPFLHSILYIMRILGIFLCKAHILLHVAVMPGKIRTQVHILLMNLAINRPWPSPAIHVLRADSRSWLVQPLSRLHGWFFGVHIYRADTLDRGWSFILTSIRHAQFCFISSSFSLVDLLRNFLHCWGSTGWSTFQPCWKQNRFQLSFRQQNLSRELIWCWSHDLLATE